MYNPPQEASPKLAHGVPSTDSTAERSTLRQLMQPHEVAPLDVIKKLQKMDQKGQKPYCHSIVVGTWILNHPSLLPFVRYKPTITTQSRGPNAFLLT